LVPPELAKRHQLIPVNRAGATLIVAMSDPSNIYAIDDLKFRTGLNIEVVVASEVAIDEAIQRYYEKQVTYDDVLGDIDADAIAVGETGDDSINVVDLEKASGEAPVIKLCNVILLNAIKKRASDIHIEPYEKLFRVRYRIDGVLYEEQPPLPMKLKAAVTSRVKIMANLDISERRLPQDGRIKLKLGKDKEMDFRVSVLPTLFGEKIVLRLLDKTNLQLDMTKLGFEEKALRDFKEQIHKPFGMVLVTGPTGSGKTTTLYSALKLIAGREVNVTTIEDPIEMVYEDFNQVAVQTKVGITFAGALRHVLRQDPDIIMVGEIRDPETAEYAVQAALTGHLVFSTLHTNDAPSAVTRLTDLGVERFLIASTVVGVVAQRLVRRVCPHCAVETHLGDGEAQILRLAVPPGKRVKVKVGQGCFDCRGTGYFGRSGIFEMLALDETIRPLVAAGGDAPKLKREAVQRGMKTLRQSALRKLAEGVTTFEEVVRVTAF
ncbi:MAG: GspE/PulE family protein, partial [Thermoanaerobaculia bacterium]